MKTSFQPGVPNILGKYGELIYCRSSVSEKVFARRYSYPKLTDYNHQTGRITKNLFALCPSDDYKSDMQLYLMRYKTLRYGANKKIRAWSMLYLKIMRDMAKQDPSIDLVTLTKEEIYVRNLPCICVKSAVDAGLLPKVLRYETYNHGM